MPPLTDEQVQNEMKKMVEFIRQEAYEKYREIQVKADEDFFIEKAKAVKSEATHIEKLTEKKLSQAQIHFKVGEAMHKNKARLKVLQERDTQLNLIIEATKERLPEIVKSPQYGELLKKLTLQALYSLCDTNVIILCLERDQRLLASVTNEAVSEYNSITGTDCKVNIEVSQNPSLLHGGIIASCKAGRITLDNTLDKRLEILAEQALPSLKLAFIGPSASRKFFD